MLEHLKYLWKNDKKNKIDVKFSDLARSNKKRIDKTI